jgi:hypothetical protein
MQLSQRVNELGVVLRQLRQLAGHSGKWGF